MRERHPYPRDTRAGHWNAHRYIKNAFVIYFLISQGALAERCRILHHSLETIIRLRTGELRTLPFRAVRSHRGPTTGAKHV